MYTNEELASIHYTCMVWRLVMLWRCVACIGNDAPRVDCQTERYLKESIITYVKTGVLHNHQAPGDSQEVQPLRRRKMFSTL
jgi:hypothetical protein